MPRLMAWVARVCRSWWGVDVAEPGCGRDVVQDPGDRVPVQRGAVLSGQQQRVLGRDVGAAVVVDEFDQLRVQRQVAVLAELADRDVQPGRGTDLDNRVGAQRGELTDPQTGAQQHLDGDPDQQPLVGVRCPQQLRRGRIVERLGQRVVLAG
jgi:hypothetical protein